MSSSRRRGQVEAVILRKARSAESDAAKYTAQLARQDDTDAAREILRDFAEAVLLSSEPKWIAPIPWHFALYIAEAFHKILKDDSADASRALGLRPNKAGRPRDATNKSRLGAAYWLLVRHDRKSEDAIKILSKETGADRRTIQRAAKDYSRFKSRRQIDDELLKFISGPRIGAALSGILDAE